MTPNKRDSVCSVCGSANVTARKLQKYCAVPYSEPAAIYEESLICNDCGSEIDTTPESEVEAAIESSKKESIKAMLGFLVDSGYSLAQIERALEIPQRTLSRWKSSSDLSSVGLALLRILRTYPWIVDVAESRFDESVAAVLLMRNAFSTFTYIVENSVGLSLVSGGVMISSSEPSLFPQHLSFVASYGKASTPQAGLSLSSSETLLLSEEIHEDR